MSAGVKGHMSTDNHLFIEGNGWSNRVHQGGTDWPARVKGAYVGGEHTEGFLPL